MPAQPVTVFEKTLEAARTGVFGYPVGCPDLFIVIGRKDPVGIGLSGRVLTMDQQEQIILRRAPHEVCTDCSIGEGKEQKKCKNDRLHSDRSIWCW